MISFRCDHCGKGLKVADNLAGKKARCPSCGKAGIVPAGTEAGLPSQVQAGRSGMAEVKTLPAAPASADERTLPPQNRKLPGAESLSDAGGQTAVGPGWPKEAAQKHSPDLYDFLAPAQQADELGRLGPYRVLQVLGAGGMGVVFRAEDTGLQRLVALKAMLPALATSASAKERFFREARAAAALKHPNIVTIFQVGEDRGAPFLAMEFLEGEPLDDRLKRQGKLPAPAILHIGRQIAEGLQAAHARGLIHRDIKPPNIWLENEPGAGVPPSGGDRPPPEWGTPAGFATGGHVKILDFGLARAMGDQAHLTQSGAIVGTPAYMAPEQAGGKAVDHRCDLFSLGCVLYRMCTGEMPFKGSDTLSILSSLALDDPAPPISINPELPTELSDLVMQLLAKMAEERPQSANAVVESLRQIEAQAGDRTTRLEPRPRKVKEGLPSRTRPADPVKKRLPLPWLVGGGVLGLGALALLLFVLLRPGDNSASRERERPEGGPTDEKLPGTFTNSLGMEFVLVPTGKSWLGGSGGQPGDKEVEVKENFYLGKYEVTQAEWDKLMGTRPSNFTRTGEGKDAVKDVADADLDRFPVESVTWEDAQEFLKRLNERDKQAGWVYRLPKEAEWEYACRGGPMSDKLDSAFHFYFDKPVAQLEPGQANFEHGTGLKRTCKVGSYPPNRLGLYDMHGNVWEWCDDEHKEANGASRRVGRGGGWDNTSGLCTATFGLIVASSYRNDRLGLRVARVPVGKHVVVPAPPPPEKKAETTPTFKNSLGMEFVLVPKGRSWLGGGGGKPGNKEIEILHDFYLGAYEVTQEEWKKVMATRPSHFKAVPGVAPDDQKRFPVEEVSWDDCQRFIERLNKQVQEPGWVYRLPKEAEWEYACRGGPMADDSESAFDFYLDQPANQLLPDQANFQHDTCLKRTCKVGSYKPNRLGLYDMHGNVLEWCDDDLTDAKGTSLRVFRSGCWYFPASNCRAGHRVMNPPSTKGHNLGLRVARVPAGNP
jgi:formylglycine-generating enzyme required for sulfatase activity